MNGPRCGKCILMLMAALLGGCPPAEPAKPKGPIIPPSQRDTALAKELNAEASKHLLRGDLKDAERKVREALLADPLYGPARSNLGTIHYHRRRLYEAAWEFQYAAKLMPERAEPRNNLGMVLELAKRLEDAAAAYEEARKLDPSSTEIAGNLARVYIRLNRQDEQTRRLLEEIVLRDGRPEWVAWARQWVAVMMGRATTAPASAPAEIELPPDIPATMPDR